MTLTTHKATTFLPQKQEDTSSRKTRKPLFAGLSFACLLLALPVGRLAIFFFAPAEDYLGYGGLGVALTGFLLCLAAGTILAIGSLLQQEHPRIISFLCLLTNATVLLWVFLNLPGK
jgi:hypothetical protein